MAIIVEDKEKVTPSVYTVNWTPIYHETLERKSLFWQEQNFCKKSEAHSRVWQPMIRIYDW